MILGGLELSVSQYLCHPQSGLRWRAAQLIASCAQNMPQVQVHLLSIGALPKLLQLTDSDPHPTVRVKALYAVSCEYLKALLHAGRHHCKIHHETFQTRLFPSSGTSHNNVLLWYQVWSESRRNYSRRSCPTMAFQCWCEACSRRTRSSGPNRRSFCSTCWRHILNRKVWLTEAFDQDSVVKLRWHRDYLYHSSATMICFFRDGI